MGLCRIYITVLAPDLHTRTKFGSVANLGPEPTPSCYYKYLPYQGVRRSLHEVTLDLVGVFTQAARTRGMDSKAWARLDN